MRRAALGLAWLIALSTWVTFTAVVPEPARGTDVPGGTISVNTTWTVAGSPYYIKGNVWMGLGVTLTIEGGVDVVFDGDYNLDRMGGDILVNGNASAPVVFRPLANPTTPGTWGRLVITAGHHLRVTGATSLALQGPGFTPPLAHSLDHCLVEFSEFGLALSWWSQRVSDCVLRDIRYTAVLFGDADYSVLSNVTIERAATAFDFSHVGQPWTGADPSSNLLSHVTVSEVDVGFALVPGDPGRAWGNLLIHSSFSNSGVVFPQPFPGPVYGNNFVNSTQDFGYAATEGYDNGTAGNYWSNYSGTDGDGDGIGDTSYFGDQHPVMSPFPDAGNWTGAPRSPAITASYPDQNQLMVPLCPTYRFEFSEPMVTFFDPWYLWVPPAAGPTQVSWPSETRFEVACSPGDTRLARDTDYTVALTRGMTSLQGTSLASNYAVTFHTIPPPMVASVSPSNGSVAPTNSTIEIRFNLPMNRSSVEASLLTTPPLIYGALWTYENRTLTLVPTPDLAPENSYTIVVNGSSLDAEGMALGQDYAWSFTTMTDGGADPPPVAVAAVWPSALGDLDTLFLFAGGNSTDPGGVPAEIVAWRWDFGDGTNATTPNATHRYASRGTFLVNLTVWDAALQNASANLTIQVLNRPPTAQAGPDLGGTKGDPVTLNASASADPDGDPLALSWRQGSGPPATLTANATATPSFTPTAVGAYVFEVTVSDGYGGAGNDTVEVSIAGFSPVAVIAASATAVLVNGVVSFNGALSSDSDGAVVNFSWDFGDGSGAVGVQASHDWDAAAVYTVTLTVTDDDGLTATAAIAVNVTAPIPNRPPTTAVVVTPSAGDVRTNFSFDGGGSSDPDDDPLNLSWDFGDGSTAMGTTASHRYAAKGTYTVTLTVEDVRGGAATATAEVTVGNRAPDATSWSTQPFVRINLTQRETFRLTAADADGDPLAYTWTRSGEVVGTGTSYEFVPPGPGLYEIVVTVEDGQGGVLTHSWTVRVNPPPPSDPAVPLLLGVLGVELVFLAYFLVRRLRRARKAEPPGPP